MILERLELKNFKRFSHADIQFKDGITGILGNNGTGKSSLVQAIFFVLYGVQGTGIDPNFIVSSFVSPKETCDVRLEFRVDGTKYTILRSFKKGKTVTHDAKIVMGENYEKLLAKGVSEVDSQVRRILGIGPVDFKNTIYAGQKDLLTLLENTPGKRKEWFIRALGIDFLKAESEKIVKDQIDAKTADLQKKEGELSAMTTRQSTEEFAAMEATAARLHAMILEHTQARDRNLARRKKLEADLKLLAEKKTVYVRLVQKQQTLERERDLDSAQAKNLEASLALLADEEAEYHRIEKTAGSYVEIRKRLDGLQQKKAEFLRLTGEIGFVTREIADLGARAEKQRTLIRGLEADAVKKAELIAGVRAGLETAQDIAEDRLETAVSFRLAEINTRTGTLDTRQKHYKEEREKILADQKTIRDAGPDGTCPLCRQKLGSHFGSLDAEFTQKLQELTDKAAADREKQEKLGREKATVESLKPLLGQIRTFSEKLRQKPVYEAELADLEAKRTRKIQDQAAINSSLAKLAYNEEEYLACERETVTVQKVQLRFIELGKKTGQGIMIKKQLGELTSRITQRNTELTSLSKEIAAAAFSPDEITERERATVATESALRNEEVMITGAQKDLDFTRQKIAEFKKAEAQIAFLQKEAEAHKDEIELLRLTRSLIGEYVVYLMQVVRSRLEGEVSRIISEITGGRYEYVRLDSDFNLFVRDISEDYPIERFSGGEQDDIAVALRIALSRYLAELHGVHESTFLIFDEIFGSQDEERRNNLLTALRTQESRFPQILLISHIAEMQGEFANTLVVEMGTDMVSRVREVGD